jgi:hypothetical protein
MIRRAPAAALLSLGALLVSACGNVVAGLDDPGATDSGSFAGSDTGLEGEDSGSLAHGDASVGRDASDATAADATSTVDAWVNDGSEDPFSFYPPDASPDSRAGINEACLRITIPYLNAPIVPPYAAAGLDLHGGPTGNGSEGWNPDDAGAFQYDPSLEGPGPLTLDEVQSVLCFPDTTVQCAELNDAGGGPQTCIGWTFGWFSGGGGFTTYYYGTAADGGAPYNVSIIQLESWAGPPYPNLGYAGTVEATGADGTHVSIGMGVPITRTPSGGSATAMDFASNVANGGGAPTATTRAMLNELYAAMMAQFLPGTSIAPDCVASGECNAVVLLAPYLETLVFVPLHLEIDIVVNGPFSGVPTNGALDLLLFADPPPLAGE